MSYSEAITKNDLMRILDNIGYAKDDWTVPNITKNKAGNTEYTTTGGSPKTIMSISHHTNTGRFVILSRAVIKTSRYTSTATLYVDGNYVDSTGYNTTNLTTPVTVNPCGVFKGERDKTYTIELKIDAQDSGTTVTAPAYNPAQLIAIDILSTQSKGSRILECYPVGSYYETSDSNFNPNTEWGGTWVLESGGRVHVSAGKMANNSTNYWGSDITNLTDGECNFIVGESGGETKHTLDATQMPSHYHNTQAAFSIRAMSYNGGQPVWGGNGTTVSKLTGNTPDTITQQSAQNTPYNVQFNKNSDSKGGSKAHNNMQPYIVVNRWHRTA